MGVQAVPAQGDGPLVVPPGAPPALALPRVGLPQVITFERSTRSYPEMSRLITSNFRLFTSNGLPQVPLPKKMAPLQMVQRLLPEGQGQGHNLVLTVIYVPCSFESASRTRSVARGVASGYVFHAQPVTFLPS